MTVGNGEVLSLPELKELPNEDVRSVWAEGIRPTGREYSYVFVFEHPHGQYIKIDSETRAEFLERGDEEEAQADIVDVAQQTRRISGGVFHVHPFYGAVWGTKLTPVAPDFGDIDGLDKDLTMFVNLSDAGKKFDAKLTREAQEIGSTVVGPSPEMDRMLNYLERAGRDNPNQRSHDQAINNGLGEAWDEQFREFNRAPRFGRNRIPRAMEMTPGNIADLLQGLGDRAVFEEVSITRVHFNND